MEIISDYNITRLFLSKEIHISIDRTNKITLVLQPVSAFYENNNWNAVYHMWTMSAKSLVQALHLNEDKEWTSLEIIELLIFDLGRYVEYRQIYTLFIDVLSLILPEYKLENQHIVVNGVTITNDIWEYILYLLKLSNGEKVEKPLIFSSEEAKQFYLAQKAYEDKIKKVRNSKEGDADALIKMMLSITYSFPSITIDYLFNQTMAQIQWLQKMAAGAVSYEVNAQAFAAGNVKKGKKLDFFIK